MANLIEPVPTAIRQAERPPEPYRVPEPERPEEPGAPLPEEDRGCSVNRLV